MNRLAKINLTTKTELSLLKDKLYLFLNYLEFDKDDTTKIVKTILEVGFNELFDEREFTIEIKINEESESYSIVFEVFTLHANLYFEKIQNSFEKVRTFKLSGEMHERLQISVPLDKANFYPTTKFLKFVQFLLNQLSSNEMIKELEQENKKLRDYIIGLNNEKDTIEKKLETRSMFLAYLSHEIRTPMSGILGFSDILLKTVEGTKQIGYLNKIKNSGNDLLNIVNDILDFSKLEAGMITIENIRFNFLKLLKEIEDLFLNQAKSKGLDFTVNLEKEFTYPYLIGDPLRLKQILINLINNAIKFTHKGHINVRIVNTEEDQFKTLKFFIEDTGIGIKKDVISKLFSPYIQADNEISRRFGGTGLGLFICKQLIELMGGVIEVESIPGKGSVFSFILQFELDSSTENNSIEVSFEGLNSLIVDSYLISSEAIAETLIQFGFVSESISFSQDALDLLKERAAKNEPFHLVIVNYDMPFGLNGMQTAKMIKSDPLTNNTKVVVISAYSHENEIAKYGEYIDAFIQKPVSKGALLETISEIFKDHSIAIDFRQKNKSLNDELGFTGLKVLLADDSPINQELVTELLTARGVKLTIADNGKSAIEKVANEKFDAILMDINMPEIDGIVASAEIRNDNKNQTIPIIAITAEKEKLEGHLNAGINDYIIKPFLPEELYSKISKWVLEKKSFQYGHVKQLTNYSYSTKLQKLKTIGVNIDEGIKRVNDKVNVYESLLNNFRKSYSTLKKDFEAALTKNHIDEARRLVHTAKGASGTIGASKLSNLARDLEADLENGYYGNESKTRFFNELEKINAELNILFSKEKNLQKSKIPKEKVKKIILHLQDTYTDLNNDVGLAIEKIDEIVEICKNTVFYDEINNLAEIIYSFNIENAKVAIKKFIAKYRSD